MTLVDDLLDLAKTRRRASATAEIENCVGSSEVP